MLLEVESLFDSTALTSLHLLKLLPAQICLHVRDAARQSR